MREHQEKVLQPHECIMSNGIGLHLSDKVLSFTGLYSCKKVPQEDSHLSSIKALGHYGI